jgi:mRNA interferase RelE/StbE
VSWTIEYDPEALTDLRKLDRTAQRDILDYMDARIANAANPRQFGKPLRSRRFGLRRYRVRDYRIICERRSAAGRAGSGGPR